MKPYHYVFGLLLLSCGGRVTEGGAAECRATVEDAFLRQGFPLTDPVVNCICVMCQSEVRFCVENPDACVSQEEVLPHARAMVDCAVDAFVELCPGVWDDSGGPSGG